MISTIFVCLTLIFGFQVYQYQENQTDKRILERAINESKEAVPGYISGIKKDISILQESTFDYHIIK